ncbi:hypothetical protein cyc_07959 [Cyclospora cayetanensis]|uniref:Uncharacterized protein n=1 Tax=Cyclospora cayetanensis TaxID=88456 RepID=A0A1D3CR55_9EIME|nr:hypothetical protein cyc_07959 [Cyclospora cayetanensis]
MSNAHVELPTESALSHLQVKLLSEKESGTEGKGSGSEAKTTTNAEEEDGKESTAESETDKSEEEVGNGGAHSHGGDRTSEEESQAEPAAAEKKSDKQFHSQSDKEDSEKVTKEGHGPHNASDEGNTSRVDAQELHPMPHAATEGSHTGSSDVAPGKGSSTEYAEVSRSGLSPNGSRAHGGTAHSTEREHPPYSQPDSASTGEGQAAEDHAGGAHGGVPERTGQAPFELSKKGTVEASVPVAAPPSDKFVLQLNFRPSMVIGRSDADRVEKHLVTEKDGTTWFQVVGPKELAVLKIKPLEGESLLNEVSVSKQAS